MQYFVNSISDAEMLGAYEKSTSTIEYGNEVVPVVNITVPVSHTGDKVIFTFLESTETLFDINIEHICNCGNHKKVAV